MSVLFLLIGASLLVAVGFLLAFIWATANGQYEDEYADSVRILFDNNKKSDTEKLNQENSHTKNNV